VATRCTEATEVAGWSPAAYSHACTLSVRSTALTNLAKHASASAVEVEGTGGTMHVESRPGKGTALLVELPIDAGQSPDAG
jgi:hypothetical protein